MSDETVYDRLERQLRSLLQEERDFVANAGNFAALVRYELPDVNWAGFYLTSTSGELVLGPFSGLPACTRIAPGRGVCGNAADKRQTVVVDDVNAYADHIACDAASRSEIVVPIVRDGGLFGVFDVDSPLIGRFSEVDRSGLERLVSVFSESLA